MQSAARSVAARSHRSCPDEGSKDRRAWTATGLSTLMAKQRDHPEQRGSPVAKDASEAMDWQDEREVMEPWLG